MLTVKTTTALYRLSDGSKKNFVKVEERNCWPTEPEVEEQDIYFEESGVFEEIDAQEQEIAN